MKVLGKTFISHREIRPISFYAYALNRTAVKLKIIEADAQNKIQVKQQFVFSPDGAYSTAIRAFHRTTLNHAITMIEAAPQQERDFCTSIFAIDQNDLPEMQKDVRDFQDMMYRKYAQKATADRVYSIQNQLVPYTTRSQNEVAK